MSQRQAKLARVTKPSEKNIELSNPETAAQIAARPDSRARTFLKMFALVALIVLAYLPALRGGFIWDDDDYVTENRTLRDLNGLRRIWFEVGAVPQYYPLIHTTFWIEYHLWSLRPFGYHAVNVLLHAAAAMLAWRVLARLRVPGAWLAATLFALHPVQVESVAWITERKNVLSAVFYFAAALAYLRFADGMVSTVSAKPRSKDNRAQVARLRSGAGLEAFRHWGWGWYFAALLLFVAALLSKTVTCSLSPALLLVCWWKKGRLRAADIFPLAPFFVVGIAAGLLTGWVERQHVGATGADWSLTFIERCLVAGRALWFYASKLVWPAKLTFIYPRWEVSAAVWWQWLFPLAALGVVAALWRLRERLGRGPLVAVLIFAGTLVPALGFVNVYPMRYSFVADHFQYLASVGLLALGAVALNRFARKLSVVLPMILALLTWQQAHIYRDVETLWRDTLEKNPICWMAHNNLGEILENGGQAEDAEKHYREALRLKPGYAEALNNLGHVCFKRGEIKESMNWFQQALQREPRLAEARVNLGAALFGAGRADEGIEQFQKALATNPSDLNALNNLGIALMQKKQYAAAIESFEAVLRINPKLPDAQINFGNALVEVGRLSEAVNHLQAALVIDSNNAKARVDLARALAAQGDPAALAQYEAAVRAAPDDAATHYNLGVLLAGAGRTAEAIEQFRLAIKFQPSHAEAHNNLGVALAMSGKVVEAIGHFNEALKLNSEYAEAHNNLAFSLIQLNRRDEAIQHLHEALRIKPDYSQAQKQLRDLGAIAPR